MSTAAQRRAEDLLNARFTPTEQRAYAPVTPDLTKLSPAELQRQLNGGNVSITDIRAELKRRTAERMKSENSGRGGTTHVNPVNIGQKPSAARGRSTGVGGNAKRLTAINLKPGMTVSTTNWRAAHLPPHQIAKVETTNYDVVKSQKNAVKITPAGGGDPYIVAKHTQFTVHGRKP